MWDCADPDNKHWESGFEAFGGKTPSREVCELMGSSVTLEAMHMLGTVDCLFLSEVLLLLNRYGGKDLVRQFADEWKTSKILHRLVHGMEMYLSNGNKKNLVIKMPR